MKRKKKEITVNLKKKSRNKNVGKLPSTPLFMSLHTYLVCFCSALLAFLETNASLTFRIELVEDSRSSHTDNGEMGRKKKRKEKKIHKKERHTNHSTPTHPYLPTL